MTRIFKKDGQLVATWSSKGDHRAAHPGGEEITSLPEMPKPKSPSEYAALQRQYEQNFKGLMHIGRVQVSRSPIMANPAPLDNATLDDGKGYAIFLEVGRAADNDWVVTYRLDDTEPVERRSWPFSFGGTDDRGLSRASFEEGRHQIACTVEDLTDGWTKTVTAVFWVD